MKKIFLTIKKYWHTVLLLLAVIFFELWREEHKSNKLLKINKKIGEYKAKIKEVDIKLQEINKQKEKNKNEIKSMDRHNLLNDIRKYL